MNKTTKRHINNDVEKIKAALINATYHMKDRASDLLSQSLENAKDKKDDIQRDVTNRVKKHPLAAIGIAALAGAVVGFIFRRK